MDLRGHGDSDTTFRTHGDVVTGQDLLALIDELGGPAVVLGNSMGGGAAAWAAAERPDAVAGVVLYGGFLRNPKASAFATASLHGLYRLLFVKPWGTGLWASYYKGLNKATKAPWLDEHAAAIRANLAEPGRLRSFRHLTIQLTHAPVEARLPEVHTPMLAFVGDQDPDFKDPGGRAPVDRRPRCRDGPRARGGPLHAGAASRHHGSRNDRLHREAPPRLERTRPAARPAVS